MIILKIVLWIPSAASAKEQLAVLDLNAKHGVEQSLAEALSVEIRDAIHSFGKYEVLSRDDLEAIAERTKTQQLLGCDNSLCLVDFGKKIGTQFMVAGSLSKIGDTYSLSLRLIKVVGDDTGVKKRESKKCRCKEDDLINTARSVAALVMGKDKPSEVSSDQNGKPEDIGGDGRFVVYDDGTVLDTSTGLMWSAKDNGENINWNDAKNYCENYQGGGFTDWRLPAQDELAKLYDKGRSYRCKGGYDVHLTDLISLTSCCMWASETSRSKSAYFNFRDSYWDWRNQASSKYSRALPVRRGKSQER
ncbi:MAG: DUF1566 domain-containing protein [Deltaproteobacteria bacterium]|nr:DUF1566 domain-containing protein [Deltaproteobacteria bacterium]